MFCCYLLEDYSLLIKGRKRVCPDGKGDGKELGGGEGREIVFRLYCVRKESLFNKKEK